MEKNFTVEEIERVPLRLRTVISEGLKEVVPETVSKYAATGIDANIIKAKVRQIIEESGDERVKSQFDTNKDLIYSLVEEFLPRKSEGIPQVIRKRMKKEIKAADKLINSLGGF